MPQKWKLEMSNKQSEYFVRYWTKEGNKIDIFSNYDDARNTAKAIAEKYKGLSVYVGSQGCDPRDETRYQYDNGYWKSVVAWAQND
jgi:hypothetical protein